MNVYYSEFSLVPFLEFVSEFSVIYFNCPVSGKVYRIPLFCSGIWFMHYGHGKLRFKVCKSCPGWNQDSCR